MSGKKFTYENREVDGQDVLFESQGEQWNVYRLEDGTTLKIKNVLMQVIRLDAHNDLGDPVYQLTSQQVIAIEANPALKKKAQ